jgi:LmbE family N-acetylglucosaminyl deacetylase
MMFMVFASEAIVVDTLRLWGGFAKVQGMLKKIKTLLRRKVRGIQRGGQCPVLLPGHVLTATGVQTPDGATRNLDAPLLRALALCNGSRTLAQVAATAKFPKSELIRAHDDGLILFWRSAVPAEPPTLSHAPHSIILSPHLDDAALSCGGRMLGDQSVLVVNVFNRGCWWRFPYTLDDAHRIQACRYAEESLVSRMSGSAMKMLDLPEALLRGHPFEELFTARPDNRDDEVAATLRAAVGALAREYPLAHWFLPLAVGEHIDHHIVRDSAIAALTAQGVNSTHLHFYEDLPYSAKLGSEADFSARIAGMPLREESLDIEEMLPWKVELLRSYWSQLRWSDFAEVRRYARAVGGTQAAELTWTPA